MKKEKSIVSQTLMYIFFLILGVLLSVVIHELSHYIAVKMCGGTVVDISIGIENFVSCYVDEKYKSFISLSSVFMPLFLLCIFAFFKNAYVSCFNIGFSVAIFMNIVLGIYAIYFEKSVEIQNTYDVTFAYNNSSNGNIILILSGIWFVILMAIIINEMRKLYKYI